jgi:hypothetical protein
MPRGAMGLAHVRVMREPEGGSVDQTQTSASVGKLLFKTYLLSSIVLSLQLL